MATVLSCVRGRAVEGTRGRGGRLFPDRGATDGAEIRCSLPPDRLGMLAGVAPQGAGRQILKPWWLWWRHRRIKRNKRINVGLCAGSLRCRQTYFVYFVYFVRGVYARIYGVPDFHRSTSLFTSG